MQTYNDCKDKLNSILNEIHCDLYNQSKVDDVHQLDDIKGLCNEIDYSHSDTLDNEISSLLSKESERADKYKTKCRELSDRLRTSKVSQRKDRKVQNSLIQNISEILKLLESNYENYNKQIKKNENDTKEYKSQLSNTEDKLTKVVEESDERLNEISRLTEENIHQREELSQFYNTNRQLSVKCRENEELLREKVECQENTENQLKQEITTSYNTIDSLRSNIQTKCDQLNVLKRQKGDSDKLSQQYKLKVEELVQQINSLAHENEKLKLEKTECERLKRSLSTTRKTYERKLIKSEEHINEVNQKYDKQSKLLVKKDKELLLLKNEITKKTEELVREKLNKTKINDLIKINEKNSKKIEKTEKIKENILEITDQLNHVQNELCFYKDKTDNQHKFIENYEDLIGKLKDKIDFEQSRNIEFGLKLDEQTKQLQHTQCQNNQLEKTLSERTSTCERLEHELLEVRRDNEDVITCLKEELTSTMEELEKCKCEKNDIQLSLIKMTNDNEESLKLINQLRQSETDLSHSLDYSQQKTAHVQNILLNTQQRVTDIENDLWRSEQERLNLSRREEDLRNNAIKMERQTKHLEGIIDEFKTKCSSLENHKSTLESKLRYECERLNICERIERDYLTALNSNRKELKDKSATIKDLAESLNSFRGDFMSHLRDLDNTVSRQKNRSSEISNKIIEMTNNIKTRDLRIKSLEETNSNLHNRFDSLHSQMSCEKVGYENNLKAVQNNYERQRRQNDLLNTKNRDLENERMELEGTVNSMNEKLRQVMTDFGKMSHQFERTLFKKRNCESILRRMRSDSNDLVGDLEARIDSYLESESI